VWLVEANLHSWWCDWCHQWKVHKNGWCCIRGETWPKLRHRTELARAAGWITEWIAVEPWWAPRLRAETRQRRMAETLVLMRSIEALARAR
jgi:hypothetical protein